jgi:hypothetical protein
MQRGHVPRADRPKMPPVEGYDQISFEPFGERDDCGICATKRKVCVLLDELRHPRPVVGVRGLNVEMLEATQERRLRGSPEAQADKVEHFGHDERGDDQFQIASLENCDAPIVIGFANVRRRVEGSSINDRYQVLRPASCSASRQRAAPPCSRR